MAMNPDAGGPDPTAPTPRPAGGVEWEIVERIAGDPWSAELMAWRGAHDVDGLTIPVSDDLIAAISELARRQDDIAGLDEPIEPAAEGRARAASLLSGLGRSTGSSQADRWLSGVPVRLQIVGGAALLVVFVLIMLIGSLR